MTLVNKRAGLSRSKRFEWFYRAAVLKLQRRNRFSRAYKVFEEKDALKLSRTPSRDTVRDYQGGC